jgi:hypothetical protein
MASKNSDDAAILDTTPNNDDEHTLLLNNNKRKNNSILSTPNVDTIRIPSISTYRPTNILVVLLFIEFLTILILWFAGNQHIFLFILFIKFLLNR